MSSEKEEVQLDAKRQRTSYEKRVADSEENELLEDIALDARSQEFYEDLLRAILDENQGSEEMTLQLLTKNHEIPGSVGVAKVYRKLGHYLTTQETRATTHITILNDAALEILCPKFKFSLEMLVALVTEDGLRKLVDSARVCAPKLRELGLFIPSSSLSAKRVIKLIDQSEELEGFVLTPDFLGESLFEDAEEEDIESLTRSLCRLTRVTLEELRPVDVLAVTPILCTSTSLAKVSLSSKVGQNESEAQWNDDLTKAVLGNTSLLELHLEGCCASVRPPAAVAETFRSHLQSNERIAKARALLKRANEEEGSIPSGLWPKAIAKLAPRGETATYLLVRAQIQNWI